MPNLPQSGENVNPKSGDITLSPFYHDAVHEITRYDKYVTCSQYLVRRWMPGLGALGLAIVLSLRSRCYDNRSTHERRDTIKLTIKEIAAGIGVSEKTVRREFENNQALKRFVVVRREYVQDSKGGFRTGASSYQVAMDDPVHPADAGALNDIIKRKADVADKGGPKEETALERARRAAQSALGQNDHTQKESENKPPHFAPGQNDHTQNQPDLRSVTLTEGGDKMTNRPGQNDQALKSPIPETNTSENTTTKQDVVGCFSDSLFDSLGQEWLNELWDVEDVLSVTEEPAPAVVPEELPLVPDTVPEPIPADVAGTEAHRRLVAEMVAIGMAGPVAAEYAVKWPEECRTQVDFYEYVDKSTVETPGGFLRSSIDGKYGPPPGWHKRQKEIAEAEAARKKRDDFNASFDAKEAAKKKAGDQDKARAEAMLARLTEAERESLDNAARVRVSDKGKVNPRQFAAAKQTLLLMKFQALPEDERQQIERAISPPAG